MKRHILRRIVCLFAAAVMMTSCAVTAYAEEVDRSTAVLDYENAPEGTVYIDILVPILRHSGDIGGTNDVYAERTEFYNKEKRKSERVLLFDKNSEIANYIDGDGFVSLSAHTDFIKRISIHEHSYPDEVERSLYTEIRFRGYEDKDGNPDDTTDYVDIDYLRDRYGSFRAAYVGKNGEVLGVTGEYEQINEGSRCVFKADGGKLTLKVATGKFDFYLLVKILIVYAPFVAAGIVVIFIIRRIVRSARSSKE